MKRREFIIKSSVLAAAGFASGLRLRGQSGVPSPSTSGTPLAAGAESGPPTSPPTVTFTPLRRNVGIFTGRGGTVGWLASPDALVVVDTQFPATTVEFLKGLPGREGRAIDVVINSHHHPDHTGGNSVFRPVTKTIVAQKLVPQLQFDQSSKERGTGGYQIYADTTFDTDWSFDAGDEKVSVKFLGGPAHTASDSIIFFEKANVVHVADFVFNRQYPMTDRPGGCNIQSWITTLETIASTYPKDAIYVFGHAKKGYAVTGTPADLLGQRDYLTGLLDYVGGQIKAGTANLTGQEIPGFPDWKAPLPNFLGRNLAAAWQELKGEPRPQYGKT